MILSIQSSASRCGIYLCFGFFLVLGIASCVRAPVSPPQNETGQDDDDAADRPDTEPLDPWGDPSGTTVSNAQMVFVPVDPDDPGQKPPVSVDIGELAHTECLASGMPDGSATRLYELKFKETSDSASSTKRLTIKFGTKTHPTEGQEFGITRQSVTADVSYSGIDAAEQKPQTWSTALGDLDRLPPAGCSIKIERYLSRQVPGSAQSTDQADSPKFEFWIDFTLDCVALHNDTSVPEEKTYIMFDNARLLCRGEF